VFVLVPARQGSQDMAKRFQFEEPDFDNPDADASAARGGAAEGIVEYAPQESQAATGADAVLRRHEAELMALPGVKGVGRGAGPVGQDCIEVYLAYSGAAKGLPKQIEGVPVCTSVVGEVDAYGVKRGRPG
jgi:hypothetical protein